MSLDPVRHAAWSTLVASEGGASLDAGLDAAQSRFDDPRDRRFLAELVRGAVQWRARYDRLIDVLSRRKGGPHPKVRLVLRLGLHQLLAMDRVPAYAAVDQSVRLTRRVSGTGAAPYVNGLLQGVARRVADGGVDALRPLFPDPAAEPAAHLAAWESHPEWLVTRWIERFGLEDAGRLCRCDNRRPHLDFRVLEPAEPEAVATRLATAGCPVEPVPLDARALRADATPDRATLADLLASEPDLIVQDAAVQAATAFLGAELRGRMLDLCAAPGGKTVHLLARLGAAAAVVAADRSSERLGRIAATMDRTGRAPLGLLAADGLCAPFADGRFDAVLLDGPCSGTGVLRRHPDGRWRLRPDTPASNAETLLALAREARRLLVPGGLLLYATCSLEPEENEWVVDSLLSEYPDLAPAPVAGSWQRAWWPHRDGADGFFAARIRRIA